MRAPAPAIAPQPAPHRPLKSAGAGTRDFLNPLSWRLPPPAVVHTPAFSLSASAFLPLACAAAPARTHTHTHIVRSGAARARGSAFVLPWPQAAPSNTYRMCAPAHACEDSPHTLGLHRRPPHLSHNKALDAARRACPLPSVAAPARLAVAREAATLPALAPLLLCCCAGQEVARAVSDGSGVDVMPCHPRAQQAAPGARPWRASCTPQGAWRASGNDTRHLRPRAHTRTPPTCGCTGTTTNKT